MRYSEADATDANAFLESLDSTLFPGLSSSIEAHSGFANEQAKTATTILSNVQKAIAAHSAKQVTIVGHSLGEIILPVIEKLNSYQASVDQSRRRYFTSGCRLPSSPH